MNNSTHKETGEASLDASPNFDAMIASLRTTGAAHFDPVRLHYLEALAKRATAHHGYTKHVLNAKLSHALAAFKERFDFAQRDAKTVLTQSVQQFPHAAKDLERLFLSGDFNGLRRFIARLNSSERSASLGTLVRQLEEQFSESSHVRLEATIGLRPELKTIQNFRNTWSKLSNEKQLAQALEHGPKNAGPLNSHLLVLRSLTLMREISPDYLNRFMSYADTLLCLDECDKEKLSSPKKLVRQRPLKNKPS